MVDNRHEYYFFPEADEPAMVPLAFAFVRMMFAHAAFEREVRDLQGAVTGDPEFGERPGNQWRSNERPECMADLIRKHLGDIPETAAVIELLARAMPASHERNLYVHGEWWRFNTESRTVTVRRSTIRPGEQPHVDFTAVDLDRLTETLKNIEVELFTRRRAIEAIRGNN